MNYLLFLIAALFAPINEEAVTVEIDTVVEKVQDWTPPRSADPFIGMMHNRNSPGMYYSTLKNDKVQSGIGLGIGNDKVTYNLNNKTIWTDGIGIYGWTGDNDPIGLSIASNAANPEAGERTLNGLREDMAVPEQVVVRNGTIIANRFTNLTSAQLFVAENIKYVTANPTVGDDEKLPVSLRALSQLGNDAILNNVQWSIDKPDQATFQLRAVGDPAAIAGYVVPNGQIGMVRLTVTGTNRRGVQKTAFIDIEIVPGAAEIITIETLPPIIK